MHCHIGRLMQCLLISCGFLMMRESCLLYGINHCLPLWKDTRMNWRKRIRRNLYACWITRSTIWLLQKFEGNFGAAATGVKKIIICRLPHLSPSSQNLLRKTSGTYHKCQWRRISLFEYFFTAECHSPLSIFAQLYWVTFYIEKCCNEYLHVWNEPAM